MRDLGEEMTNAQLGIDAEADASLLQRRARSWENPMPAATVSMLTMGSSARR